MLRYIVNKGVNYIVNQGLKRTCVRILRYLREWLKYFIWLKKNEFTTLDYEKAIKVLNTLSYKPVISIIVPVFNVEEQYLKKCLDSVLNQVYENWELCIADDASDKKHVRKVLKEYQAMDDRIKVVFRHDNGHISAASNSALELATGDYIALLDHDDELTPDALFEVVALLNKHSEADMIYSDEDKISETGVRHSPYFKPDWSPDTFLTQMYTCHLGVYRSEIIKKVGGFRIGFEGSQDYDLVLMISEATKNIYHIPKVLYHWRTLKSSSAMNSSVKEYAYVAGEKAIQEALDRRGEDGTVKSVQEYPGHYLVSYPVKAEPTVSLIIMDYYNSTLLVQFVESLLINNCFNFNMEIIIAVNRTTGQDTAMLYNKWRNEKRVIFIEDKDPLKISRLVNKAVNMTSGDILLLLNRSLLLNAKDDLVAMIGYAMRSSIGAVGALCVSEDKKIINAGYLLGGTDIKLSSHKGYDSTSPGYFGRLLSANNCSAVSSACLMVKKEHYRLVGGFDEELSNAFSDVDFCLKLSSKGFYNVVLPYVRVQHQEVVTNLTGFDEYIKESMSKEAALIYKRWQKYIDRDPFYNPNLTLKRGDYSIEI